MTQRFYELSDMAFREVEQIQKEKKVDKWQELDIRRQTVVVCFRNPVHTANSTPTKFHHLDILQH